jgi:hypothetical protein
MRLEWLLFASTAVLLLIISAAFLVSPSRQPASQPHPIYQSLESTDRGSQDTLWLGYSMGLAILSVMATLVLLGVSKRGRLGALGGWLAAGFVCLGLMFTGLVTSYAQYAAGNHERFFGGLPAPTAWMIYGVWLFPMLMILVCSFHFDRWYFTREDQRAFENLIRSTQPREDGD